MDDVNADICSGGAQGNMEADVDWDTTALVNKESDANFVNADTGAESEEPPKVPPFLNLCLLLVG